MVHFGTYLTSFRNPAWAEYYLSYELLKGHLYELENELQTLPKTEEGMLSQNQLPQGKAFEKQLSDDLQKINKFYESKLATLHGIFQHLKSKVEEEDMKKLSETERDRIKDEFHALYVELNLLRDYSSLNYTGFSKILKKHDKILPQFKMKRDFFKREINLLPVFGVLDELYRLIAEIQHVYSEHFSGYNRLDTEISFGEALAKATSEMQQESGNLRKKMLNKADFSGQPLGIDSAADHLLMSEYMQGYRKQKDASFVSNALWQRARVTIMAVQSLRKEPVIMPILVSLFLIFVGGCGQAFCLEYMVKIDPGCGSTITFFQFLFVTFEGLKDYVTWDSSKPNTLWNKITTIRMKPLKIPMKYHVGCVLLSWLAAILSSWAYSYRISVPFHMVFKSSILLVNMTIGVLVLGRRYSFGQIASVLLVTFGVMISTYASLPEKPQKDDAEAQTTFWAWLFGLGILAISLVFTGFLGILQDLAYRNYGQHWKEALFYAHFLGLPLFLSLLFEVWDHVTLWTVAHPFMWVVLALNTIASVMGVKGMYNLTGLTSSLTGNLTITVRKFVSLIISIVYFNNMFTFSHWTGASLVLVGTVLYTGASQQVAKEAVHRKEAEHKKTKLS